MLTVPQNNNMRRDSGAVGTLHELADSKELKKALECPICKEVPLAPIYTCSAGHTTCGKCRTDQRCGICKEDLSRTARNATVEMIVSNSSFWCKYLSDGCPKIVKGGEYRDHLANCTYRRIECFETESKKCMGQQVRFKDYFKHLKEVHDIQGFNMRMPFLTMSEYSNCLSTDGPWPLYYLQHEDDVFLRHMSCEKGVLYLWFTILGSQEDANEFKVKTSVYMKHNDTSRIDWTVPVYSVRASPDELRHCFRLAIPTPILEKYCTQRKHPHGDCYKFVMDLRYEILSNR